jgi:uncharacterized protein YqgV (UPF0045/DUF77 family)
MLPVKLRFKYHYIILLFFRYYPSNNQGVDYRVGAMETVMQGPYDTLMDVAKKAQQACLEAGADEVVVTMKVHAKRNEDVDWEDKLSKYGG